MFYPVANDVYRLFFHADVTVPMHGSAWVPRGIAPSRHEDLFLDGGIRQPSFYQGSLAGHAIFASIVLVVKNQDGKANGVEFLVWHSACLFAGSNA
jgi:hypothetical protein